MRNSALAHEGLRQPARQTRLEGCEGRPVPGRLEEPLQVGAGEVRRPVHAKVGVLPGLQGKHRVVGNVKHRRPGEAPVSEEKPWAKGGRGLLLPAFLGAGRVGEPH